MPNVRKLAMFTIQCPQRLDVTAAADILGVTPDDLDANFGVVMLDPKIGSYCVQKAGIKVSATVLSLVNGRIKNLNFLIH